MNTNSFKCLLAASAVVAVTTCSYADFDSTFDSPAQANEASGNVVWSSGPVGWTGGGCLQDTDPNGSWGGVQLHQLELWFFQRAPTQYLGHGCDPGTREL